MVTLRAKTIHQVMSTILTAVLSLQVTVTHLVMSSTTLIEVFLLRVTVKLDTPSIDGNGNSIINVQRNSNDWNSIKCYASDVDNTNSSLIVMSNVDTSDVNETTNKSVIVASSTVIGTINIDTSDVNDATNSSVIVTSVIVTSRCIAGTRNIYVLMSHVDTSDVKDNDSSIIVTRLSITSSTSADRYFCYGLSYGRNVNWHYC